MPLISSRSLGVPMRPRDTDEAHRVSTPLELLFDLTFVFAASQVATELAHAVAAGHPWRALPRFLMVFFAIWWAWVQFTWFASGFDTDDALYRVVTLVQMAGVLVLAAGVPEAFDRGDFATISVGYVVMRLAMVSQWLRAGRHPSLRMTAHRYAAGVTAVQLGWLLRLLLPNQAGLVALPLLVLAEIAVPVWAERPGGTRWHPHHVAERYGLFAIIALGECVRASATAADAGGQEQAWADAVLHAYGRSLRLACGPRRRRPMPGCTRRAGTSPWCSPSAARCCSRSGSGGSTSCNRPARAWRPGGSGVSSGATGPTSCSPR